MRIEAHLDQLATQALREALDVEAPPAVRKAQDDKHGDYQINGVLGLAKRQKKNPRELAEPVAAWLRERPEIFDASVAGPGFINLRLDDAWIAGHLRDALLDRERDGVDRAAAKRTVVVDFSSPNIAKQMHVGHLRSTIIGAAIVELLRFVGHEVIGDNHLGDWGTQFGLLIVGMRRWGDEAALDRDPVPELERVYKLASAEAKTDEAFAAEARAELAKLQSGDPDNRALWERFRDATRRSLETVYQRLGVEFDEWLGESAYDSMLAGVVEKLVEEKIAREDDGAIVVWFNELEGAPKKLAKQKVPFIVRKSDGAFLYSTTDVATVLYRQERWGADAGIYVVDKRQAGHFEQLFEIVRQLGLEVDLQHVGFGMVQDDSGKAIRTRDGETVTLARLLDQAEERARAKMIDEQGLAPELAEELRAAVGIGAVKYADLCQNRTSDYRFDWDKMIAFEGNAGPYLQYAHARCCSIVRKGEVDTSALEGATLALDEPAEKALGRRLLRFSDVVHSAAEHRMPHHICDHLYALSRDFSRFYTDCPVLKAEGGARASRLALVDLTRRQMRRGLELLGIEAPERM